MSSADRAAHLDAAARALRTWLRTRDGDAAAPLPPPAPAPLAQLTPIAIAAPVIPVAEVPPVQLAVKPVALAPSPNSVLFASLDQSPTPSALADPSPDEAQASVADEAGFGTHEQSRPSWPVIAFPRRALMAAASLLVLVALGWTAISYRSTLAGAWRSMATAGSAALTPATTGTVVFESVPDGAEVVVDGADLGTTPLTSELEAGRHVVEFRRGAARRRIEVEVVAGRTADARVDWAARRTGGLQVESVPTGATIVIGGRERGVTPLTIDDLDAGSHTLVLRSAAGTIQRTVTVAADRLTSVSEAIYSGWLHVSAPIELVITRGGQRLRLDDRSQALLPPGAHEIVFENAALGFNEARTVEVTPGATTRVAIEPPLTALTVTATQPSEVFVDGERAGETSVIRLPVTLGTHHVVVRSTTSGVERQVTVTATTQPVALDIDFSAP